jgi:glycosyltransferase involved in cell wall biosynthesis
MKKSYAFIIPAYNPDGKLIELVEHIQQQSDYLIFIIDDGSKETSKPVFDKLKNKVSSGVVLLGHAINMGKGAALKTVFNHILVHYPEIEGVVTLDSDGQHSVEDCLRILNELKINNKGFVLGYRTFSKNIPLKSYIGNNISRFIYRVILGHNFKDTQTGLRGLSKHFMRGCLSIKSNRFEFETEQLAKAVEQNIDIVEIPIETIYIEGNKATSFRPLVDSFKIYFVLFRYGLSSIITAIVDFVVFMVALSFGASIMGANYLARSVSIGVQFILLGNFVFKTKTKVLSFILFALYVYGMGTISAITQLSLIENWQMPIVWAKVLVEGILFFVNFAFLRMYIFTKNSKKVN